MKMLAFALALLAVAGCAATDTSKKGDEVYVEKEMVTGSNLPKRSRDASGPSPVTTYNRESLEKSPDVFVPPRGVGGG